MTTHSDSGFTDLVRRVRQGDADAAFELVNRYEPELRIIARVKLNDPQLRRFVDSMDICQSVLANFFVRASAGQFDIQTPDQLQKLLFVMIKNKVTDHARQQKAERRDVGRMTGSPADELPLAASGETPSQILAIKELASEARKRFCDDELAIIDLRMEGIGWAEIANRLGATPERLRKKMTRALDRVAQAMGLDSCGGSRFDKVK